MTKATDILSEFVILIAFPQQWFHERTSMLRYTYIACLVETLIRYANPSIVTVIFSSLYHFLNSKQRCT